MASTVFALRRVNPSLTIVGVGALLALQGCAGPRGRAFDSPQAGVEALVSSIRTGDDQQLREILGPEGDELISSGDPVADQTGRQAFLAAYEDKHVFVPEGERQTRLVIGEKDWPMPIPVVRSGGGWRFDTAAGRDEILARRIGRNELAAIEVCRAVVDAQREYARSGASGAHCYAQRFVSQPGRHDGLYWPAQPGEPVSPLGELVAQAVQEGYDPEPSHEARPYHGYFFHMLTAQGPDAPGGARSYLDGPCMSGGFGVVAWPATYDNSGVMTFIVNHAGVVYQKNLGPQTHEVACTMSAFDPGEGWAIVP